MKAQGWRERYAGYEPGLHDMDVILRAEKAKRGVHLRTFADSHAGEDWRLASSRPLKPVRKVNGIK